LILHKGISVMALLLAGGLIGCSGQEGPNDPGMTHDQIKQIREKAAKESDGTGPSGAAPPGGHKR